MKERIVRDTTTSCSISIPQSNCETQVTMSAITYYVSNEMSPIWDFVSGCRVALSRSSLGIEKRPNVARLHKNDLKQCFVIKEISRPAPVHGSFPAGSCIRMSAQVVALVPYCLRQEWGSPNTSAYNQKTSEELLVDFNCHGATDSSVKEPMQASLSSARLMCHPGTACILVVRTHAG